MQQSASYGEDEKVPDLGRSPWRSLDASDYGVAQGRRRLFRIRLVENLRPGRSRRAARLTTEAGVPEPHASDEISAAGAQSSELLGEAMGRAEAA